MELELCIDTLAEARVACELGLHRIECCSALALGGLTPGPAMIQACARLPGPDCHVLVRPRPGGFQYTGEELRLMERNIRFAAEAGASGVVFGALDPPGIIAPAANSRLLAVSRSAGLQATFHRAFDLLEDPFAGLEELIRLGFHRVLTSGGQPLAIQGLSRIRALVERAEGRIQIMAGSGVSAANARLLRATGVTALHFSARQAVYPPPGLGFGDTVRPDAEKVRAIRDALA